ncbi:hypothetical protein QFC19_001711 [Naganishia cerealis]|uniref:Uncharacterized protein n=1 Tax=Naganishia cerealis TaxID=610337 RepID=A0ACC2WFS6_9TREE|nr:hypothetical protein QFC19_001711 [Naganishia cerealis]
MSSGSLPSNHSFHQQELESWLKSDESESAGWPKEGGEGETIAHESGKKIVEILRENPDKAKANAFYCGAALKNASKYTDEQVDHMRRVVSYCARHLAQEEKMKETKSEDDLEKTKSTKSLKNWGHDPIKALHQSASDSAKQNAAENTHEDAPSAENSKGKGKGKSTVPEAEEEASKANRDDDQEDEDEPSNRLANRPKRKRAGKVTEEDLNKLQEEEGDDYDSEEDEDFEPGDDDDDEGEAEEEEESDEDEEEDEEDEEDEDEEPSKKRSRLVHCSFLGDSHLRLT